MNEKLLAGLIIPFGVDEDTKEFYTDDFKYFYYKNDQECFEEDLKAWALWINSPWNSRNQRYTVTYEIDLGKWVCEYNVVGYEGFQALIWVW